METVVYVMDSLGERLCEGCKRGYLLRFDGASDEPARRRRLRGSCPRFYRRGCCGSVGWTSHRSRLVRRVRWSRRRST